MPIGTLSPEDNPVKSCDVANKPYRVRIQTVPSHFTGFKCIFGYRVVLGEGGEQWLSFKSDLCPKETSAVSRCLPSHLNTVSSVDSCVKELFNYFLSYGYILFMFSVKFDIERISTLNYNL